MVVLMGMTLVTGATIYTVNSTSMAADGNNNENRCENYTECENRDKNASKRQRREERKKDCVNNLENNAKKMQNKNNNKKNEQKANKIKKKKINHKTKIVNSLIDDNQYYLKSWTKVQLFIFK